MLPDIHPSWKAELSDEFCKDYFKQLSAFVASEYEHEICYPPKHQIFAAFERCDFNDVKVVIIGQDPYHNPNQANGLSFSVNDNQKFPPSLKNIFSEICDDIRIDAPVSGNLERWSNQGVLLLNAVLTVRQNLPHSHKNKGWELFTDAVIKVISHKKKDVVFMLWGGYAKKKGALIDRSRHLVLESGHPSPLSANKGLWFKNGHFSQANTYLKSVGKSEINW